MRGSKMKGEEEIRWTVNIKVSAEWNQKVEELKRRLGFRENSELVKHLIAKEIAKEVGR